MRWLKIVLSYFAVQSAYSTKTLEAEEETSLVSISQLSADPSSIINSQGEFPETSFFHSDLTPMRYNFKLDKLLKPFDGVFKTESLFELYDKLRSDGAGPVSAVTAVAAGTAAASYYYRLGSLIMAGSLGPVPLSVKIMGFGIGFSCIPLGNEIRELMAYKAADYLETSDLFTKMDNRVDKIIHDSELNLQSFMGDLKGSIPPWAVEEFKKLQQIPLEFKRYLRDLKDGALSPTSFEKKVSQLNQNAQDNSLRIKAKLASDFAEEKATMPKKTMQTPKESSGTESINIDPKLELLAKEAAVFHAKFAHQEEAIIRNEFKTQIADLGLNIAALSGNKALKFAATSLSAVVQLSSWIERVPQFAGKSFPLSITPQLAMVNIALSTILSMGSDNDGLGEYLDAWFNHVLDAIQTAHAANMEAHQQTHKNQLIQLEATVHYGLVTLWGLRRMDDYAKLGLEHDAVMEARLDELMSSGAKHHTAITRKVDDIFDWMSQDSQEEKAVEIQRVLSSLRRSGSDQYVSLMENLAQLADITTALPAVTEAKSWESTADSKAIKVPTDSYLHVSTVLKELARAGLLELNVLNSIFNLDKDQRHPVLLIQVIAGMLYAVNKQYPQVNESNDKLRITETDLGILEEQLPRLEAHHKLVFALRDLKLQEKLRGRTWAEAQKVYATLIDWRSSFYKDVSEALVLKTERLRLEEHAEKFREDFFDDEIIIHSNYRCEAAVYDFSALDNFPGRYNFDPRDSETHPVRWFTAAGFTYKRSASPLVSETVDKQPVFRSFMKNRILSKKRVLWESYTKGQTTPEIIYFDSLSAKTSGMPLPFSIYPMDQCLFLPILPYPVGMTNYLPQAFQQILLLGLDKISFYYELLKIPENNGRIDLRLAAHWKSECSEPIAEVYIPINSSFYAPQEDIWRIWSGGPHTLNQECNQHVIYETHSNNHEWKLQFIPKDYGFLVHGGEGPADKPGLYDQIQNGDLNIVFQENSMAIKTAQLRVNEFMREKRLELRDYLLRKLGENPKLFSAWNRNADLLKMTMSLSHMDVAKNPGSKLYSLLYGSSGFKTSYDLRARLEAYTGEGAFIEEWLKELSDSLTQLEHVSRQIFFTYKDELGDSWISVIQSQLQQLINAHRSASNKPVKVNHWRGGKEAEVECEVRIDDLQAAWNNRFIKECIKTASLKIMCDYEDFVQSARKALIPTNPVERNKLSACLYRFDFSRVRLAGVETGSQLLLEDGEDSQETNSGTLGII